MLQRELIRKVKRLEMVTRRKANNRLAGQYHSVFKGRGMDFDEVQPYAPGDDVRFIDWNVSARTGDLFIKKFVEERELTVLLLVDASASVDFGTTAQTRRDIIAELTAVLAFSAIRNNDRVGLLVFTDRIERYIPPKKGRRHVLRLIRDLLGFRPEGTGTDINGALEYATRVTSRRAVVFLLSDFIGADYERGIKLASRRHDVVPLVVEDPIERELPEARALVPLRDRESGALTWVDLASRRHREIFRERAASARARREQLFRRLKLDHVDIDTHEPYIDRLVAFFRRRASRY